jgi:hypothetical protein
MAKSKQIESLSLVVVFTTLFLILIVISVIFKIINLIKKSTFDMENHFTVSVISNNKNVSLVSLAPKSDAIYILNIKDGTGKNLPSILEVPIDSEIYADKKVGEKNLKNTFLSFLIPFSIKKTNLTFIDIFRLWLFTNSVPSNSIYEREVLASDKMIKLRDPVVYSYFVDQAIAEEKISIEIVNGTDVFGLGNKLASFLTNIGANIVMVSTSDHEEAQSKISYLDNKSYTLKKISSILKFKTELVKNRGLGDITITIGKDALSKIDF